MSLLIARCSITLSARSWRRSPSQCSAFSFRPACSVASVLRFAQLSPGTRRAWLSWKPSNTPDSFWRRLEGPGGWYRYHALFAAAMRHEAGRRLGEEALRELSLQASAWYEQEALLTEAIEAAYLARDMERVARLIKLVQEQSFSEPQTMLRWLEQLPEAVLREHPMLCFLFATELRFPVKLRFA